jgi:hypothetical protein
MLCIKIKKPEIISVALASLLFLFSTSVLASAYVEQQMVKAKETHSKLLKNKNKIEQAKHWLLLQRISDRLADAMGIDLCLLRSSNPEECPNNKVADKLQKMGISIGYCEPGESWMRTNDGYAKYLELWPDGPDAGEAYYYVHIDPPCCDECSVGEHDLYEIPVSGLKKLVEEHNWYIERFPKSVHLTYVRKQRDKYREMLKKVMDLSIVDDYVVALNKIKEGNKRTPLAKLYNLGFEALIKLRNLRKNIDQESFSRQLQKLEGFKDSTIHQTDTDFWLRLVEQKGTVADRDYFRLYNDNFPQGRWSSKYHGPGGCGKYGTGQLAKLATGWLKYSANYRKSDHISNYFWEKYATEKFEQPACACGDKASVIREYNEFIRMNPNYRALANVKARLNDVKADKSRIKYFCGKSNT